MKKQDYHAYSVVLSADAWGVEVPDVLRAVSDGVEAKKKAEEIEKARKEYAAACDRMNTLGLVPA